MKKVFIDGEAGTTGLRIRERLAARTDIELVTLPEALPKDAAARKTALNAADITFLCLPDAAAVEAVSMIENPGTVVLDTSTAHRTDPRFVYGFPELAAEQAAQTLGYRCIRLTDCLSCRVKAHRRAGLSCQRLHRHGRAAGAARSARAGRGAHLPLGHGLQRRR